MFFLENRIGKKNDTDLPETVDYDVYLFMFSMLQITLFVIHFFSNKNNISDIF